MKLLLHLCLTLLLGLGFLGPGLRAVTAQSDQPILFLDPGGHTGIVRQALFTPGGRELISVGEDKVIRVWDTQTGKQLGTIHGQIGEGPHGQLYAAALSRDGKTLAVAGNTYEGALSNDFDKNRVYIHLIHLEDLHAQPMRVSMSLLPADGAVKAHMSTIFTLAFSPTDNTLLASGSLDNNVCLWNTHTGSVMKVLEGHERGVDGLAWSPDGTHLASASLDGTVRVWNARSGNVEKELKLDHLVRSVAWSPDAKMIAAGSSSGVIVLYQADGYRKVASWSQSQSVSSLAFSPDGQSLVSAQEGVGPQYPVKIWTVPGGRPTGAFQGHTANVTSLAFSDDGRLVASAGGRDNDVYLWQLSGTGPVQTLRGSGGATSDVAWSQETGPEGRVIYRLSWKTRNAGGTEDEHVFDFSQAMTTRKSKTWPWQGPLTHLPDGRSLSPIDPLQPRLAVTVGGGQAVSFPPTPGPTDFTAQSDFVLCDTFTPDGSGVLVGSRFSLALYSASSGALLRKFVGHSGPLQAVAVTPDGKYLASASSDQTVAVWPLGGSRAEVPSPLVQLFAGSDNEYVAWNPEYGYYACSPEGERLIGWQTNNGEGRLADYAPASSFVNRNRPAVMRLMLDKGSALEAIAAAGSSPQKIEQTAPRVDVQSVDGVSLTADQAKSARFKVTVTAHAGGALESVSLSVNGHQRAVRRFGGADPDTRDFQQVGDGWVGTLAVKLPPGADTVTALATGVDKAESPRAGVAVTTPTTSALPTLNLLAIGIAKYDRFLDLNYPDADAVSIAKAFKDQEGKLFSRVDAVSLTNGQATKAGIEKALADLKRRGQAQDENDYTVVFVAGHGGDVDAQKYYLIPSDVDTSTVEDVKRTAVEWSHFDDALQSMPGNVIFLLDACHSAGKGGSNNAAYAAIMAQLEHRVENGSSPIITFASCEASETSQEDPQWKHGAFTLALLDGLAGAADERHNGRVDAQELEYFIHSRVIALTGGQQHTQAFGTNVTGRQTALTLAIVGPARTAAAPATDRQARR